MADYGFIANPVQQNTFQKIGEALSAARSAQAFQRERQTFEADVAQRLAESSSAQTAADLAKQTLQPRVAQQQAATETAQTGARAAAFKLEGDQSAKAMQIASGLVQDPRIQKDDANGIIDAANESYSQMVASGIPKNVADFWASQIKAQAHQPGGALRMLSNVTRAASGPATTAGVINAPLSTINTGAQTLPVQLQPGAPGAMQPVQPAAGGAAPQSGGIPNAVPPTAAETQGADALGRPVIVKKNAQGQIEYAPPPGSNYRPMMALPAGETPETARPLLALRDQSQTAAAQVPQQRFYNREIINLADSALSGTGSAQLSKLMNTIGIQNFNTTGSDTSKMQHFIALQVEKNAAAQGANTDSARKMAENAVIPGSTPAQALKAITRINDAYATGVELFNTAMQATLQNPANVKDVFAIRDLQNAWAANLDPRVFMLENAAKAGDTKTVAEIKKQLGEAGMKDLLAKARTLDALTKRGAVGGP